jgi:hypothetical protein
MMEKQFYDWPIILDSRFCGNDAQGYQPIKKKLTVRPSRQCYAVAIDIRSAISFWKDEGWLLQRPASIFLVAENLLGLGFDSSQFDLDAIHGVGAVPDLNIGVVANRKSASELKGFYESLDVVIKQSAKIAALVKAQVEFVAGFHPDGAIVLHFKNLGNDPVANLRVGDLCHQFSPSFMVRPKPEGLWG